MVCSFLGSFQPQAKKGTNSKKDRPRCVGCVSQLGTRPGGAFPFPPNANQKGDRFLFEKQYSRAKGTMQKEAKPMFATLWSVQVGSSAFSGC